MIFCRHLNQFDVVNDADLDKILCYPNPLSQECSKRLEEVKSLGIKAIFNYGSIKIGKLSVIGKGHAGIVTLAYHNLYGYVALKIRRIDSKRDSLRQEALIMKLAEDVNGIPRVYDYTDNFIVREYIDGYILRDYISNNIDSQRLRILLISLIELFYKLDIRGIDVEEIRNPLKQIVVRCDDPRNVYIIDLESARIRKNSNNLPRVLSFILNGKIGDKYVYEIIDLGYNHRKTLLLYATMYKRGSNEERREMANRIIDVILGQ
ncbi:Ser/Thr protein kinase [Ignisphaera aggregans DSM 17230]|uniref:Ser/Thr protein kinase n=1 Tax=Ignisphaera aggregans (strain DSM 17230 / JCM 13409 / AQ1.S1) TaxID=583356 RepID=E0SSP6_IGNAA|nr:Ser/Thr protein kinase [Ignisphaera aggregans DSM 17230]